MSDEKLLSQECKKYNPIAQKELYEKYNEIIMALCYRYTGNMVVAEDLMQDSLIKVLTKINKFNWIDNGSFDAWIKKVAVNTCLHYLEKNKKKQEISIESENLKFHELISEDDPELHEINIEELNESNNNLDIINNAELSQEELLGALTQIPEIFRIIFNLHVIEGIKHQEIARMLKINVKTSKTRLYRARKLLKKMIYNLSIEKLKAVQV